MKPVIPWHRNVTVLQTVSDIGLIGINKPINVLSHPNTPDFSASSIIRASYCAKNESFSISSRNQTFSESTGKESLFLLHRLDRSTSGVLLLADSLPVSNYIKSLFKARKVSKKYVAIVHSPIPLKEKKQTWVDKYEFRKGHGEQIATTEVSILNYNIQNRLAQLWLEPKTGFTHQLRIQCALRGIPILGDDIHGDFAFNRAFFQNQNQNISKDIIKQKDRLYLHAHTISLPYNFQGIQRAITISSDIPADFTSMNISKGD